MEAAEFIQLINKSWAELEDFHIFIGNMIAAYSAFNHRDELISERGMKFRHQVSFFCKAGPAV